MNAGEPEPRQVPVDVLPPLPKEAPQAAPPGQPAGSPPPFAGLRTFYHPASGVVILGIDVLVFGPEMLSGFLDLPVMCALAFFTTLPLVWVIQSRWSKDTASAAFGKAFDELLRFGLIDRAPRMIVVQAAGANPFAQLWRDGAAPRNKAGGREGSRPAQPSRGAASVFEFGRASD